MDNLNKVKREGLQNPGVNLPQGLPSAPKQARRQFGSPERVKYDYTQGQQTFDKWGKVLGVGALNAGAIQTRRQIEAHERDMLERERSSDKKIADNRIAATIATITSNTKDKEGKQTNPNFLDATLLNNLKSKEVERYLGGSFTVTKAQKTKGGDQLYKVDVRDLGNKDLIQSFHGTTQNIIERFHAFQSPEAQIEMGNAVKKSREDYQQKLEFMESDPSVKELRAKGIPLNAVESAIGVGHSLGMTTKAVTEKLLKEQKQAEIDAETARKTAKDVEGRSKRGEYQTLLKDNTAESVAKYKASVEAGKPDISLLEKRPPKPEFAKLPDGTWGKKEMGAKFYEKKATYPPSAKVKEFNTTIEREFGKLEDMIGGFDYNFLTSQDQGLFDQLQGLGYRLMTENPSLMPGEALQKVLDDTGLAIVGGKLQRRVKPSGVPPPKKETPKANAARKELKGGAPGVSRGKELRRGFHEIDKAIRKGLGQQEPLDVEAIRREAIRRRRP